MLTNLLKGAKLDVKNCDIVHVDFVQDIYPSFYVDSYLSVLMLHFLIADFIFLYAISFFQFYFDSIFLHFHLNLEIKFSK